MPRVSSGVSVAVGNAEADQNPGVSYLTAVASLRLVRETSVVNLTEDDFNFVTRKTLWLTIDRSRVRQCVESIVYGALDFIGFPRFDVPAEFIAAAIAHYVHPVNFMAACAVMEGCSFTENVINGVERVITGRELFSHVCRLYAGYGEHIDAAQVREQTTLRLNGAIS